MASSPLSRQQEPPSGPTARCFVVLVAPLPESAELRQGLEQWGIAVCELPMSELVGASDQQLAPLAATLVASAGSDVVGAVMDLDVAGASAVARKLRLLLGHCGGDSQGARTGMASPAPLAPMVALGSPDRALEVGLWPTDAVFIRPLRVDEVVRFLAETARFTMHGGASPHGTSSPPKRGPSQRATEQSGAGSHPVATAQPFGARQPPAVSPSASPSVRPTGRRTSYRPGPGASARDEELLGMVGADDDAELQELSADQIGPGGEVIRLGSDIERLLEGATAQADISTAAAADAPRPSGEGGKRLSDESLRDLDDLLRAEDPAAVERKIVGAAVAVPTAVGMDRPLTSLRTTASRPPQATEQEEAHADLRWSGGSGVQTATPHNTSAGAPSSPGRPAGERQPRNDTIAQAPAPDATASEATEQRSDHEQAVAAPPGPWFHGRSPDETASGHTEVRSDGPPDASELLRRTTAPLGAVRPATRATTSRPRATTSRPRAHPSTGRPNARPTTSRPSAPPPDDRATSPRFSEPPPNEPHAHERWSAVVPPSESGLLGEPIAAAGRRLPGASQARRTSPPRRSAPALDDHAGNSLGTMGSVIARRESGVIVCVLDEPALQTSRESRKDAGRTDAGEPSRRWIVVRDGDIITAASSVPGETVLDFLVERGELSREAIRPHEPRLPPAGRHAVAALIAYGFLAQDELWSVLRAHAEWLLTRALQQDASCCRLEVEVPEQLRGEPAVFGGAAGVEVFLETVRRVVSPASAMRRIGGRRARFFAGDNASLLAEAALAPAVVETVHAARGSTVDELVTRFGEGFAPIVLGLVALQVLQPEPRQAARAEPPAGEAVFDPLDAAAIRERVRARLALVREGDYFALLGVSPDATDYEIRRAFVDLRRRFEPSTLLTAPTAELHDDVTLIVDLLEEAYEVLRDPWRRSRYKRALLETSSG